MRRAFSQSRHACCKVALLSQLPITSVSDARLYPDRPFLAVSAAIIREDHVLVVRRARPPAQDLYTLPGGVVEVGETLDQAVIREVHEETALTIKPIGLAGYRDVITRDGDKRVARHFAILTFAAQVLGGELKLNDELAEARWLPPEALTELKTTEGLNAIVAKAFAAMKAS